MFYSSNSLNFAFGQQKNQNKTHMNCAKMYNPGLEVHLEMIVHVYIFFLFQRLKKIQNPAMALDEFYRTRNCPFSHTRLHENW